MSAARAFVAAEAIKRIASFIFILINGCTQFEIGNSVPRRSQGRNLAMISGVSGVGLREISSKSTVTV